MATIKLKSSTGTNTIPSSLQQGEMAINVVDGNLFYGDNSSNVNNDFRFAQVGVTGVTSGHTVHGVTVSGGSGGILGNNIVVSVKSGVGFKLTAALEPVANTMEVVDVEGGILFAINTSGNVSIGHTISETTVNDNLTVVGTLEISGTTRLTEGGTAFTPRPNLYWFANCDAATVGPASDGSFPSTNTTDVSWSVTHNSHASVYTWSAEELTITRAGLYKFTYNVTLETGADGTTHNRVGGGITLLRKPDGGAYAVVAGTESYVYCRMATIDMNTGATSVIYDVTADDVFKIVFIRTGAQSASSKLGTIIAGTAWTVEAVT